MSDLIQSIRGLSREDVFEAAGFFGDSLRADTSVGERERKVLRPLTEHPFQNILELEQLARLLLLTAAVNPQHEDTVKKAVAGVGRRNLILGATEIVALSALAIVALQIILSKGRTGVTKDIEFGLKDGEPYAKIHEQIDFGISGKLASILKGYFGAS